MGSRTRRRVEHARYVGLRTVVPAVPPPTVRGRLARLARGVDRSVDRRISVGAAIVLAGVVTTAALASTLAGGGPPSATPLGPTARPSSSLDPVARASGASPTTTLAPTATPTPQPPALPTGYHWPLDHGRITTAFAPEPGGLFVVDGQPFHDGIDIATFCGDRILAAHDGVVIASGRHVEDALGWVGDVAGYEAHLTAKNLWGAQAVMVITDDGNGYRSVYVHLYKALVKVGQRIAAGDLIGWEGRTGDATGCHLHFSIYAVADTELFTTDPKAVAKSDLPAAEIARIDPMTVLPPMATTSLTWGWGAQPSVAP